MGRITFGHCPSVGNAAFAGVDNAGVDNAARYGKGGHCGSGQCRSGQIGNMDNNNRLF